MRKVAISGKVAYDVKSTFAHCAFDKRDSLIF